MMLHKTHTRRDAFTLVEVLLAVMLSAFLIAMITSAIYLNVRVLQRQQNEIERSQIARNVLMMIKSDIRAAIQYKPADVTGLENLTLSQEAIAGAAGAAGIDPSAVAGAGGQEPEDDQETGIGTNQTQVLRPGLYGTSTQLMIDVSRLPRIDQYDPIVVGNASNSPIELPTDVKTVGYFVSERSEQSVEMEVGQDIAASGGLYRRQLDRAVASFSPNLAATLASIGNTKLIANEVIGIRFRYFDGENWVDQWNSDDEGGFPGAVEVTIVVDNERLISEEASYALRNNVQTGDTWRTVINLPVAEILSEEELEQIANGGAP